MLQFLLLILLIFLPPLGQNPSRHSRGPGIQKELFRRSRKKTLDLREHGSSKTLRNGGDSDVKQIENFFKDSDDRFGIKRTQKVS